jgi:hypothetical protein
MEKNEGRWGILPADDPNKTVKFVSSRAGAGGDELLPRGESTKPGTVVPVPALVRARS